MKTKTAAIRHARENVGELYRFGGQWRFRRYDLAKNAAWESTPRDYHSAVTARRDALLECAWEYLGEAPGRRDPGTCDSGSWTDYVTAP